MAAPTRKTVEKEIRARGGERLHQDKRATTYRMPDGHTIAIDERDHAGRFARVMDTLHERYGSRGNPTRGVKTSMNSAPKVVRERLSLARHAVERFNEMKAREPDLTPEELFNALTLPMRVMWSDRNQSWIWVGPRVAVAAIEKCGGR